jgi:WD40 repeat protein/energy-coupling factor transporter ATP-binding protein EcfA2
MGDTQHSRKPETVFPYPGLRPFQPHEAHLFFGRDEHVSDMFTLLENHRFLAVTGASGSGKSSLVRAGLLPRLRNEGLINQASGDWHFLILRPGKSPMDNLALAFHEADPLSGALLSQTPLHDGDPGMTRVVLESGPRGVSTVLRNARIPDDDNVLILVDQFEEIFRFTDVIDNLGDAQPEARQRSNEATQFVSLLLNTARQSQRKVHVVLTMRTDFMGDCDRFEDLPQAINNAQYLTPRLSFHQLKSAATGPLKHTDYKAEIEPQLLDHILNAATTGRDRLPLIQHALLRIWTLARQDARREIDEHSDRGRHEHSNENGVQIVLTFDHARRCTDEGVAKGPSDWVSDVLARHADEIYEGLETEQQRIASHLFCALCDDQGNARVVRRPTSLSEVAAIAQTDKASVDAVVSAFTGLSYTADADRSQSDRHFLIRYADRDESGRTLIDISHESLIRNWPRLTHWMKRESAWRRNLERLIDATEQNRSGHGDFLAGRALEALSDWFDSESPTVHWADRYAPGKYQPALGFLLASKRKAAEERRRRTEEREKQEAAEKKREVDEKQREANRRVYRVLKYLVAALLVIVIGGAAGLYSIDQGRQALAAKNQENEALIGNLDVAKETIATADESAKKLIADATRDADAARTKAEADAKLAQTAVAKAEAEAKVADKQVEEALAAAALAKIEGEYLATVAQVDGRLRFGEYESAIRLLEYALKMDISDARKDVIQRKLDQARDGLRKTRQPINSSAVSRDGRTLVFGGTKGSVSVWRVRAGTETFPESATTAFTMPNDRRADFVSITPDGQRVFVAAQKTLYVGDAVPVEKAALVEFSVLDQTVTAVEVSPDGEWLVTGERDGYVRVINRHTGKHLGSYKADKSIQDLVVVPDKNRLIVLTSDQCLLIKVVDEASLSLKFEHRAPLDSTVSLSHAAIAPNGNTLVVSHEKTGNIFLLELNESNGVGSLILKSDAAMHTRRVTDLAFSLDGTRLVTASDDYMLRVWNIEYGLEKHPIPDFDFKPHRHRSGVAVCSFVDGTSEALVSASRDGTLRYLNLAMYESERSRPRQSFTDLGREWMVLRWGSRNGAFRISIADGERLLTSMEALQTFILDSKYIPKNTYYEMWMVRERTNKRHRIEVPLLKFGMTEYGIGLGTEYLPESGDVIKELQLVPIGPDGKRLPHPAAN